MVSVISFIININIVAVVAAVVTVVAILTDDHVELLARLPPC